MSAARVERARNSGALSFSILMLYVALPYGVAALTGTPEPNLGALAAWHSAAESVYCEEGLTPVTVILMVETLSMIVAALLARRSGDRWGALGVALRRDGGHLLAVMLLIGLPFLISWQTESSVCTRGRAFYWESVLIDAFILAILAISYNLLFGFTGVVSFGHALFFGLGAYIVGLLMKHLGAPWWLAILAALMGGVLIALVKGVVGLRIKGLYFALFTLAFAQVFFLLAGNRLMVNITGAEDGFTFKVPDWLNTTQNRFFFYLATLAVLVLAFVVVRRLMNSPTGRVLSALRDNESRAQMLGYNTFYFKLISIVLAGVLAALAGVLRGVALKGASPGVLSIDFTITPLIMVIIGGVGTFSGPVLGAFLIHLTEEALRDTVITIGTLSVNIGERWALILGLLFILIVLVFPRGIVGSVQAWWGRSKR